MGRTVGLFPLILVVCFLSGSRLLLWDFIEGIVKGWAFLGLLGLGRLLVYPLGLFIFRTLYFKFPFGCLVHGSWLFFSGLEGWVFVGLPGFRLVIGLPIGILVRVFSTLDFS